MVIENQAAKTFSQEMVDYRRDVGRELWFADMKQTVKDLRPVLGMGAAVPAMVLSAEIFKRMVTNAPLTAAETQAIQTAVTSPGGVETAIAQGVTIFTAALSAVGAGGVLLRPSGFPPEAKQAKDCPTILPTYTVQNKDTLSQLAAQWGTTVDGIMRANPGIKDRNVIYVRQLIKIPCPGSGNGNGDGVGGEIGVGERRPLNTFVDFSESPDKIVGDLNELIKNGQMTARIADARVSSGFSEFGVQQILKVETVGEKTEIEFLDAQGKPGRLEMKAFKLMADGKAQNTNPGNVSAIRSEPLDINGLVNDALTGKNRHYEMVLRVNVDPNYDSLGVPINRLVDKQRAGAIILAYQKNIEANQSSLDKLFDRYEPARLALNKVIQSIFSPSDFKTKQYPDFSKQRLITNTLFVDSANPIPGGGYSAIIDRGLPGIIIGPYGKAHWVSEAHVLPAFVSNESEEIIGHPNEALIDNSGIPEEEQERLFPIVHDFMAVTFMEPARLAVGIGDGRPSSYVIQAMKIMEDGGMSKDDVLTLTMRIGGGKMSDIAIAERAYEKGRALSPGVPSFYDLVVNKQLPAKVVETKDLNDYRRTMAKKFGLTFIPYGSDLFTPFELLPTITGSGPNGCVETGGGCLDLTLQGREKLIQIFSNPSMAKTSKDYQILMGLSKPYGVTGLSFLAEDLHRGWVLAGRPAYVDRDTWNIILKNSSRQANK